MKRCPAAAEQKILFFYIDLFQTIWLYFDEILCVVYFYKCQLCGIFIGYTLSGLFNSWELEGGQLATTVNWDRMDDLLANIVRFVLINHLMQRIFGNHFRGTISRLVEIFF